MGAAEKKVAEAVQQTPAFDLLAAQWPYPHAVNAHQRMLLVMREVAYVQKEDKRVNGQYTFVSHDAVIAKVRPFCIKYGILPQPVIEETIQDGNRTQMTGGIKFVNVDNPEDFVFVPGVGYGVDPQDKGPGKSYSYLCKNAILKAFSLETGDEADPERQMIDHKPGVISDEQLESLAELALDVGAHIPSFCKFLKINDLSELPAAKYDTAIKALESKRKMMSKQPATIEGETA